MTSTIPVTDAQRRHPRLWLLLKTVLPLAVLALGALGMIALIRTAPSADRKPPPRQARLVEVQEAVRGDAVAMVRAMGLVTPAREVVLHPQVSGMVTNMGSEMLPGGMVAAGELLVQVEADDYVLAVRRAESERAAAQSAMALEMGQQAAARKEFELLGRDDLAAEERALILREPQLAQAKARLAGADAAWEQARLNLERTMIAAPFNAVVRERHVQVGQQVTPATSLAVLTGNDAYWIIAPVPVDCLRWLNIPSAPDEQGSRVMVHAPGGQREGRIIRQLSDLEENGRLARVLIEIDDPLARQEVNRGKAPLFLGDFVRVDIEGVAMTDVIALDRRLVRDHDRVWVMNQDDALSIRTVEVLFREEDRVLVGGGLEHGERMVASDLSAPVEGLSLRVAGDKARPEKGP